MFNSKNSSPIQNNNNSQNLTVYEKINHSKIAEYDSTTLIDKISLNLDSDSFSDSDCSIDSTVYGTLKANELDELVECFKEKRKIETNYNKNNIDINKDSYIKQINKMQIENITALVNTFKIPDAIKDLPRYEGNRHTLYDFIDNVDEIIKECGKIVGEGNIPVTFKRAIRNKITGEADEVLTMYGTPLCWPSIRENLINHYADKRNETSLIRDLHMIHQGVDTLEKYFSRIIDIQSTILSHIRLNECDANVSKAKEQLYRDMCLSTFLAGLREPIGSMIRAWQPKTINEAFSLCMTEQNMHYLKNKTQTHVPAVTPNRILYQQPFPNLVRQPYINQPHRLQMMQNSQQSRPDYQQHRNYKPPPKLLYNRMEPMDTKSNQDKYTQPTRFNNLKFGYNKPQQHQQHPFQPTGPPKFRSEELFNIENDVLHFHHDQELNNDQNYFPNLDYAIEEEPQTEISNLDENYHEVDDSVFQVLASETP